MGYGLTSKYMTRKDRAEHGTRRQFEQGQYTYIALHHILHVTITLPNHIVTLICR